MTDTRADLFRKGATGLFLCALALFGLSACARTAPSSIPEIGTPETFDVATWNVEQFGNAGAGPDDAVQIQNVVRVIQGAGVDLWALQEISDADDFAILMDALGNEWAAVLDHSSSNLHVAYVFRRALVTPRRSEPVLQRYERAFGGRPPLLMEAEVKLQDGTTTITFINLHMKAFEDEASYARRVEAAAALEGALDAPPLQASRLIVLGDFNDRLNGSIRDGSPSPYRNFVARSAAYRFATADLESREAGTYCFDDACADTESIDHILVTDELFGVATDALRYDALLQVVESYATTTSDHLPAVVRLRLAPVN